MDNIINSDASLGFSIGSFEYPKVNIQLWEETINSFKGENPWLDISTVNFDQQELANIENPDELPDVFNINAADIPVLAEKKLLLDLTSLDDDNSINDQGVYRKAMDMCRYKGKLYAIPQEMSIPVIYCNKELLEKSGLNIADDSWHWEDLPAMAEQALKKLPANTVFMNFLCLYTISFYFNYFRPDREPKLKNYDEKGARLFMEWLSNMCEIPGGLQKYVKDDITPAIGKFIAGQMLFFMHSTSMKSRLSRYAPFPIEILRPPRSNNGTGEIHTIAWAIKRNSKTVLHSWKWLCHILSDAVQKKIALNDGDICARTANFQDIQLGKNKILNELENNLPYRLPTFFQQQLNQEVWMPGVIKLMSGIESPESCLADMKYHHEVFLKTMSGGKPEKWRETV